MVAIAATSWGTWSLFLRPTGLPPTVTTPIVFVVMGLAALPLALRSRHAAVWDRRTYALLAGNVVFDALNILTFFAALAHTTVAIAVLSHYVAPILIALAAPRVEGVTTRGAVPAAAVALVGLVVVLEPWGAPAEGAALGAALGIASAFCYAGNMFVVRRLVVRIGAPRAMAYHSLIAAAALVPLGVAGVGAATAGGLALITTGAVTIGAGSGILFAIGLVRIGSARAAVLTFAEPLVAVAVGALVWHEPLSPLALVGGAMIMGAGIHVARNAS